MKRPTQLRQLLQPRTYVVLTGLGALVLLVYIVSSFNTTTAANPSSGTINPTLGATLAWWETRPGVRIQTQRSR